MPNRDIHAAGFQGKPPNPELETLEQGVRPLAFVLFVLTLASILWTIIWTGLKLNSVAATASAVDAILTAAAPPLLASLCYGVATWSAFNMGLAANTNSQVWLRVLCTLTLCMGAGLWILGISLGIETP